MTPGTAPLAAAARTGVVGGVGPDFGAVAGSGLFPVLGAFLTIVLVVAVAMVVICGFVWALGSAVGSWQVTAKARIGVLAGLAGAVLAGAGVAWMNWLIDLGHTL